MKHIALAMAQILLTEPNVQFTVARLPWSHGGDTVLVSLTSEGMPLFAPEAGEASLAFEAPNIAEAMRGLDAKLARWFKE